MIGTAFLNRQTNGIGNRLSDLFQSRVSIFEDRIELINLVLPFILCLCAVIDILGITSFSNGSTSMVWRGIVFFNALHLLTSFYVIHKLPSFEQGVRAQFSGQLFPFYLRIAAIFTVSILLLTKGNLFFNFDSRLSQTFLSLCYPICSMLHSIGQIRGLSLLYDHQDKEKKPFKKIQFSLSREWWSKISFAILFLGVASLFVSKEVGRNFPQLRETMQLLKNIGVPLLVLLVVGMIASCFLKSGNADVSKKSNKWIYKLRLLYFPFLPFSHPMLFFWGCCHGVENMCVMQNIDRNSSPNTKFFIGLSVLFFLFTLIYFIAHLPIQIQRNLGTPEYSEVLSYEVIVTALAFCHFYTDGVIYRMRNAVVREKVSPLLMRPSVRSV